MCVLLITRLLRLVGRWARKPVNHTSWVAVVAPTDRPKSVRNRCVIELFCGVVCVVTLPFWRFCWCRGFCHGTESDLFLFLLSYTGKSLASFQGMHMSPAKHIYVWPRKAWLPRKCDYRMDRQTRDKVIPVLLCFAGDTIRCIDIYLQTLFLLYQT